MIEHQINCLKGSDEELSTYRKLRLWFYDSWIYRTYDYSWVSKLRWKITHWWRKCHWVHCDLHCTYHDKSELMEAALFTLVENYVAKDNEDAFSVVVVEDDVREIIIQILHFYRIEAIEIQTEIDRLLHEIYGKTDMFFVDCDREGCKELQFIDHSGHTKEEKKAMTEELRRLEQELFDKTQEHLKICVDIRPYLWS